MKTDDLIAAIAADGAARPASIARRMAVALGIGGLIALVLFMQSLGVRPDIADALPTWRFAAKMAVVLVSFVAALWATARLTRPDADRRRALALLALPAFAAFTPATATTAAPEMISATSRRWCASASLDRTTCDVAVASTIRATSYAYQSSTSRSACKADRWAPSAMP